MKLNHKLIKSLSLGIVSLGLLAGIGMASNNSNKVHADADDEAMAEDIAETEQSDKNWDANSEKSYMQNTWALRNDRFYYKDLVQMLNSYPDLVNSPKAKSMINYLSPKGREQFNEYYFGCSSTDEGGNLKESSDAAAGLDYDPHNSADNYLPLAHQHYISTAQEKKLQNPPLFPSDDTSKSKKHHIRKVAKHHSKHIKAIKSHRAKKTNKAKKHGKKITRTRAKRTRNRRARKISSKKQVNKLNKQLRNDKRALKSRKAKHNYKLRKFLNKSIRNINKKLRLLK